jgi:hypothetical protein
MDESIGTLLAAAAGKIGAIGKTEKNKEQHFMFRSIDAIVAAVKPVFADLGIAVLPNLVSVDYQDVQSAKGTRGWRCMVVMRYRFLAGDGSFEDVSMPGEAIDYGDKSTTKAAQMAFKYALTQVLQISSGDTEADAESHEIIIEEVVVDHGRWLADAVQVFKSWSADARKSAYKLAMEQLKMDVLESHDDAQRIFDHMAGQYYEQFPSDETRPF